MIKFQLDTPQRIIKSKIDLNKTHAFFSYILLNMQIEKTEHTDKIPTMAVNAYGDLWWNKSFIDGLNADELKFCLAHEVGHVATLTFQREKQRDHTIWNIATDLIINFMLTEEGFTAPKGVLVPNHCGVYTFTSGKTNKPIDIDLNDKNAEQVYDELMKHAKIIKVMVEADGEGNFKGQVGKHIKGDKDDNGKSQGKGNSPSSIQANENNWKRKAVEASTQAKMRGQLSETMERMVSNLLEPVIDWRNKLFAYITNDLPVDYTMRFPSRRSIATGFYAPTVIKESLDLIVGVDVSGSISIEEYTEFMSEVIGIVNSYRQVKIRVIAWASTVDERDDIEINNDTQEDIITHKFYNSGGTTLSCLTDYIIKKEYTTKLLVVLTDGYVENKPTILEGVDTLFILSKQGTDTIVKNHGDVTSLNNVTI